jgi:mRNA interferase MazF
MICNAFDVVEVPFPFSDLDKAKMRKALVLSQKTFNQKNGNSILMMITSATHSRWFLDTPLQDLQEAGLRKPCVARLKLFTLDNALLVKIVGALSLKDRTGVLEALKSAIPQVVV